jgi:hypothetical protein
MPRGVCHVLERISAATDNALFISSLSRIFILLHP